MMKNLNEQLNIDLNNGTWSTSTTDNNAGGGSNAGGKVSSTNPKSPDYYNDYETDEIISGTGKNINNNNTGDYSDYDTDEEISNTTTQANDYSDYSDDEKIDNTSPTTSNTKTPTDNTRIPMAPNKLTTLSKIELDIMKQYNPLEYKTLYDKLGAIEKKTIDDKLAGK